jgi:mannose-6-phosphate isomerase-like protein (cupin superfamily)
MVAIAGRLRRRFENESIMIAALSPKAIAASLTEHWSPRVVAELDDTYVKVARIAGDFVWHAHDDEDEMFYVLDGRLRIELEQGSVELAAGDMCVVPKGIRHRPSAHGDCLLMLIERKTTLHIGNVTDPRTRSISEQLRGSREQPSVQDIHRYIAHNTCP